MKMEYKTVTPDRMVQATDPSGGGWEIKETQMGKDGKVTFLLERPAALGVLRELQDKLRYATSVQREEMYGSGMNRKNPDECPYCGNTNVGDMQHEYNCPYGTLIRLEAKTRELIDKVT